MSINEIMKNQPIINIGCLGCVSDGKSTMVDKITGVKTQKYGAEKKRNITIKLGYANAKIYKCNDCDKYFSTASDINEKLCDFCESQCDLVNHISFVDCPGHHDLILTLLSGVCVMDQNIFVVSSVDSVENKPKLLDHMWASKNSNLPEPIFCLNKLDLIDKQTAEKRANALRDLVNLKMNIDDPLIIPTSFNFNFNTDYVIRSICEKFKIPERDMLTNPKFLITRTFDVNPQNLDIKDLKGGVVGGSLITGILNTGDEIEIRPGFLFKDGDQLKCHSLKSKIYKIKSGETVLEKAYPGGLIALELGIDPYFTKQDNFCGQRLGLKGTLPECYHYLKCDIEILDDEILKTKKIKLMFNSLKQQGLIVKLTKTKIEIKVEGVLCIDNGDKIILSSDDSSWIKILGVATFIEGDKYDVV
jgi:translation initiation factor 2 subunit 3